jgi:hypothetical protein
VCHPCAGAFGIATITFPGGTTTANATVTPNGTATTCSVGCHQPLRAQPHTVSWNAGPQLCTDCHNDVPPAAGVLVRSSHLGSGTIDSSSCAECHDTSSHTSGQVRLQFGNGTSATSGCTQCHSGQGATLVGNTPPLLVGWTDAVKGDFHGARPGTCRFDYLDATGQRTGGQGALACPANQPASPNALRLTSKWWYASGSSGAWAWTCAVETLDASGNRIGAVLTGQPCPSGTALNSACGNPATNTNCYPTTVVTRGFGGTLRAPFTRGQHSFTCDACHDFHSSSNVFLFASTVNGAALPPGVIDRAGVGAQALCNSCHEGDRHQLCKDCHKEIWTTDGEYSWFEGNPVDPVPDGAPCFYCHGHEGISHMVTTSPQWPSGNHPFGGGISGQCDHCHSSWAPPPTEYVPPAFTTWNSGDPAVSGVTATTATVTWQTTEPATSYVEYGIGTAGYVAGTNDFSSAHTVTLTGLQPGSTYLWRVRTSDVFRNVTEPPLQAFKTPGPLDVPRPDLTPVNASATVGTYTITVNLTWITVTAPSGTAIQYEVQLAEDPAFTSLLNGSIAGPGVPGLTVGDSGWVSGTSTTSGTKPAASYPATITNIPQDDCTVVNPRYYYWRVRARDQQGHVSDWSDTGNFGVFAGDPWC